jgi:hypothetical protein
MYYKTKVQNNFNPVEETGWNLTAQQPFASKRYDIFTIESEKFELISELTLQGVQGRFANYSFINI